MMPTADEALISIGPRRFRAGVFGVRTSTLRVGQTLGPVGFTATAESAIASPIEGYRLLLLTVGGVMLLVAVGSYLLFRDRSVGEGVPAGGE